MLEITKILSDLIIIFQKEKLNFFVLEGQLQLNKGKLVSYSKSNKFPLAEEIIKRLQKLNLI